MLRSGARSPGNRELRRHLRDLAALTALPAVWSGESRRQVAEGVAEALVAVLQLDAAYVRLQSAAGEEALEVARAGEQPGEPIAREEINRALSAWMNGEASDSSVFCLARPGGNEPLRAAVAPIGYAGEFGFLLAASALPGFPGEEDRLL